MDVDRRCSGELNWASLRELPEFVANRLDGQEVLSTTIKLDRHPDAIRYDTFDQGYKDVKNNGEPESYAIHLGLGSADFKKSTDVSIQKYLGQLVVQVAGCPDLDFVDAITEFLGLVPEPPAEPEDEQPRPKRTAFIAHRFDDVGDEVSNRLARFLELIGFRVVTGRGYSPQPISDKVKARIEQQALTFVIFTPGDDQTWLVQESILAEFKEKPLIIVRDERVESKSGLLADREYISFEAPRIETAFIPIVEGLRELGYAF